MTGLFNWVMVFVVFIALIYFPLTQNSLLLQNLFLLLTVAISTFISATLYYKNGAVGHGLAVGAVHIALPLLMDALVTVPFILIPYGSSYDEFYTNPILLPVIAEVVLITYAYWQSKVKASFTG